MAPSRLLVRSPRTSSLRWGIGPQSFPRLSRTLRLSGSRVASQRCTPPSQSRGQRPHTWFARRPLSEQRLRRTLRNRGDAGRRKATASTPKRTRRAGDSVPGPDDTRAVPVSGSEVPEQGQQSSLKLRSSPSSSGTTPPPRARGTRWDECWRCNLVCPCRLGFEGGACRRARASQDDRRCTRFAHLRQLLPLKTPAEYDPAPVSGAQARRAVEAAKRLVEHAEQKLNEALPC